MTIVTIFNQVWKDKGYHNPRKGRKEFINALEKMTPVEQIEMLFNSKLLETMADNIAKELSTGKKL